jgi:biopolymer transport protein ExbB
MADQQTQTPVPATAAPESTTPSTAETSVSTTPSVTESALPGAAPTGTTVDPTVSATDAAMNQTTTAVDQLASAAQSSADAASAAANPYGLEALWSQGDMIIKAVALILLLMSIASWYIIITRGIRAVRLQRAARRSQHFWHAQTLEEGMEALGGDSVSNPFRRLAEEGAHARDHHSARRQELHGQLSLAEWLTSCLRTAIDESAERMQSGLSVLASVGSTAPFVGLFGTVWGIYHALVGIGVSGQASIDKVAGPVGEALIMTAFGLAVAIPAVLGYNVLVRANKGILGNLNRFAHHLHALLVTGAPVSTPALKVARLSKEAS